VNSISALEAPAEPTVAGPIANPEIVVDDLGWYPITTYWHMSQVSTLLATQQPLWLEASEHCPDELEVLNTMVTSYDPSDDVVEMDVLVTARPGFKVSVCANSSFCSLRPFDDDCRQALADWSTARDTRETEYADLPELVEDSSDDEYCHEQVSSAAHQSVEASSLASVQASMQRVSQSFEAPSVAKAKKHHVRHWKQPKGTVSHKKDVPRTRAYSEHFVSTAKYKTANRTDEQARLFPDLEKEIAERRKRLNVHV